MSCKSCGNASRTPGRQPFRASYPTRHHSRHHISSEEDHLYGGVKPEPIVHETSKVRFEPFACVSNMPCDAKYLNTQLGNGFTIGYCLMRNRILANPNNQMPFYDKWDPTVMWSTPNDYRSH